MPEWVEKRVRDLVERHWSGEWGLEPNGLIPTALVYRSTEIDDDAHLAVDQGAVRSIPKSQDWKVVRQGDVLVETSGGAPNRPVGRIAAAVFETDERRFTSNFVRVLRPFHNVNGRFLAWKLHWLNRQPAIWKHQQQTTGIINLKVESYLDETVCIPPDIPEQTKISELLCLVDRLIEHTKASMNKQERVRAGLLRDLFTRGLNDHGELRPHHREAPQLFQHTSLGRIPRDWEVRLVKDVTQSIIDGPFGSNLKSEHYVDEPGVRVVRLQNIQAGFYDASDTAYVSDQHARFLANFRVVPGDVLIASLGDDRYLAGRACCYPPDLGPAINKADCFRVRPDPARAVSEFLMLTFNSDRMRAESVKLIQGVTRQRINVGNLKKLHLAMPKVEEQRTIVSAFERTSAPLNLLAAELNELKSLRSGLMQDLLTGRVSVAPLLEAAGA